jgi:hypothetical protein
MTTNEHTTDDEGGEAPCFAHLLDQEMADTVHAQFVIDPTDASDES